jgi:hypothetical protein
MTERLGVLGKLQTLLAMLGTEGTRLNLELLLQGVGHVKLPVVVDWVLLSSFGHSAGLKVLHTEESRELLQEYLRLVKENLR